MIVGERVSTLVKKGKIRKILYGEGFRFLVGESSDFAERQW